MFRCILVEGVMTLTVRIIFSFINQPVHKVLDFYQISPKELQAKERKLFQQGIHRNTLALVSNCLILSCGEKNKTLQLGPFLLHPFMVGQKQL